MISYHMLLPQDASDLTAHLCRLDPQERSLRFFGAVNDVCIAKHVSGINWSKAVVVGAFQGGHLVGAAELFGTADGGELAVTVDHEIQGLGIGTELVRKALLVARNRGIRHVKVEYLARNNPIRHVAGKFKPHLEMVSGGTVADIAVPSANQVSLLREIVGEALGWFWDIADRLHPYATHP